MQAVGGALSSDSEGGSSAAVDVSIAGLSFQVVVIAVFIGLTCEYVWRYRKGQRITPRTTPLSKGMILVAAYTLIIAHPGPVFADLDEDKVGREMTMVSDPEK
ncbi:MAG: hypothetical protein Q9215_007325 [Flavoplaca cf. flavocitrina]